jgi:hypothetical protein
MWIITSLEGYDCSVALQLERRSAATAVASEWPSGHAVYHSIGHAAGTFTAPESTDSPSHDQRKRAATRTVGCMGMGRGKDGSLAPSLGTSLYA